MIVSLLAAALSLSGQSLSEKPLADAGTIGGATGDDLHCLAYLSVAAGKVQGDLRTRVDGGALYYFGRIEAREPQLDIAAALERILHEPGYDAETYRADKARCHARLDPLAARFEAWKDRYGASR